MFRQLLTSKRLAAVLLPFALIWSWTGCIIMCGEISARHQHAAIVPAGEDCADTGDNADGCTTIEDAAVIQERQIVKTNPPANVVEFSSRFQTLKFTRSAPPPEVRQNSPPNFPAAPLFLRFRNFRI